jgi:ABC-type multidrug transport system fused ATPase/permease subunit
MDKIENFLKFTIPTIVVVSLSYEVCYLWGLDINIAESPLSNGDILRGWQQWYPFLSPLLIVTIYPDFLLSLASKFTNKLTNNSRNKSIIRATLILRRIAYALAYVLLTIYIMFGDIFQAYLILSLTVFIVDLSVKKLKTKKIESTYIAIVTSILLIAFTVGSISSIIGFYDKYKSLLYENSYIEVGDYRKTVIRTYENWTLVRYGFESYAWVHHQSDRKIITSTDRTHFLGAICYVKRDGYLVNDLTDTLCSPYVKIKTIEDDEDENCLLDAFKRVELIEKICSKKA